MLPHDSVVLLSYINTKLRDFYPNLDALCDDLDVDKNEIIEKLEKINYVYNEEKNQFQ